MSSSDDVVGALLRRIGTFWRAWIKGYSYVEQS